MLSIPLSTLVTLGAALHPTHQRILPLCLPESKRALFRTRVGGLKPKDGHGPHDHRETRVSSADKQLFYFDSLICLFCVVAKMPDCFYFRPVFRRMPGIFFVFITLSLSRCDLTSLTGGGPRQKYSPPWVLCR